jgi:hypothetical protein
MTGFAQTFKAEQILVACLFIELPNFVAVHPALAAANLAVITSPATDMAANTVPLVTRQ